MAPTAKERSSHAGFYYTFLVFDKNVHFILIRSYPTSEVFDACDRAMVVSVTVCPRSKRKKENGLSYQHQTWYT